MGHFTYIFLLRGAAPYTLGRLQRPPPDPSTFPHSAMHLPFCHLAINLICRRAVATSILLTRNCSVNSQNVVKLFMIFCRKKQMTNAKSGGTKFADTQHVGAKISTRLSLSNWGRTALRGSSGLFRGSS